MTGYTMERLLMCLGADMKLFDSNLKSSEISGISTDTRTIKKGDVFFALRGDRFDGAEYVDKALAAGAKLAVVNADSAEKFSSEKHVVFVMDTILALGSAARDYRSLFNGTVICVTGSSGKTTVKEMIRAVLERTYSVHASKGNFNNHIGLPLSLFGMEKNHECSVLELGMSAPGEIDALAQIARPDIGVVTNVGPAHMEFFGSIDGIADAKTELLDYLDESGTSVINGDDDLLVARESRCRGKKIRFGIKAECDFQAECIDIHKDGCVSFEVEGNGIDLQVPGLHTVYNALAAYSVGRILGITGSEAVKTLEKVSTPSMRLERIERDGVIYIDDSYNANPLSMKAAADVLRHTELPNGGRKIAVLGDMLELGSIAEQAHREAGELFGALAVDYLFLVGEHAEEYANGAAAAGMNPEKVKIFKHVEGALSSIESIKKPGDVLFVKGSRALGMEKVVKESGKGTKV
ncbi:UDP-N-acetylmuramoyl-tripeptide--D-alanyl-D-alanine ligase [Candidatus Omnitrophota bacterium]